MSIAVSRLATRADFGGTERRVQLLVTSAPIVVANSHPHRRFNAVGPERRNLFLVPRVAGTVLHRVILRRPPPSGCSSWFGIAPDDDAISTFRGDLRHYTSLF